jgi:hypothetical protein
MAFLPKKCAKRECVNPVLSTDHKARYCSRACARKVWEDKNRETIRACDRERTKTSRYREVVRSRYWKARDSILAKQNERYAKRKQKNHVGRTCIVCSKCIDGTHLNRKVCDDVACFQAYRSAADHKVKNQLRPRPIKCENPFCENTNPCFDHDHERRVFRGWLCHSCNQVFGFLRENSLIMRWLADYLERHAAG